MANVFLDNILIGDAFTGFTVWGINFNTETKTVFAENEGPYDPITWPGFDWLQYGLGQKMYDQCFDRDKYEIYKVQTFPYGDVVIKPNDSSCLVNVSNSTLYRFNNGAGDRLGSAAADVCDFEGFALIYWNGTLEVGSEVYRNIDQDPLEYSGNGWFRIGADAYRINALSEIIEIVPAQCAVTPPLPDLDPLPDREIVANFHLPLASSVNFVKDGTVEIPTDKNTLFADQDIPGVLEQEFFQIVKRTSTLVIQWGSSFDTNNLRLRDHATGNVITTVAGTKVQENLNQELTLAGFASLDPETGNIQVWFPNYAFPEFAVAGNKVNISSVSLFGQFDIIGVQDGKGNAKGNRVFIINSNLSILNAVQVEVTGKYNVLPYDVFEAEIALNDAGKYYMTIEVTDAVFTAQSATSEPIIVKDLSSEYLYVQYTNENDKYGCFYGNQMIHQRWLKARMYQVTSGGEKTLNRETNAKLVKLDEYVTKAYELEVFQIPPYLVTQFSIALSHDLILLNGISVQTEEIPDVEYYIPEPLANASVRVEEVEFTERNRAGGNIDSTDSFLLINNAGNRLLINP